MRRALLFVCVVSLVTGVRPTWAHANLLRSDPPASAALNSAPPLITLWFTEPLEPDFSRITLLDSTGNTVSTPPSVVDPADPKQMSLAPGDLPDGVYTVSWRAISAADGHSTRGSYAFSVGAVSLALAQAAPDTETIPPLSAPVRWLNLLSMALAVGSVSFAVCVACPPPQERRMRRLMGIGWVLVGIAGVALLLYQATQVTDAPLPAALASVGAILSGTRFGMLWLGRMIVWIVFGVAVWRRCYGIALAAGAIILLLHSLYSHASATYDLIPAVAGDWLHLTATVFWVGGLIQFLNVLVDLRGSDQPLAPLTARFSNYARVCVGVLVVTGLYAAWLEVGSVDALLNTLYGRALLIKLILFAPLLLTAAVNLLLTSRGLRAGRAVWAGRLRGLVGAEIVLTLSIFAAVAVMASADPARASLAKRLPVPDHTFADYQIVDDMHIHLEVSPGWVGANEFVVTLFNIDGSAVTDASLIRVRFDNQTRNVGQSEVRPTYYAGAEYKASGANLSVPGTWRARVSVQRPNKFDALADFMLDLQNPPVPPGLDMGAPLDGWQIALLVAGLGLLAVGGFAGGRGRFSLRREDGLLVAAAILVGLVMVVGAVV